MGAIVLWTSVQPASRSYAGPAWASDCGSASLSSPTPSPSVSTSHRWYFSRSLSEGETERQSPRQKML